MEQKTEASQAVDPDMLDAVTSKVAEFYPQSLPRDMEKNQRLARAILRLVNRAALKAQPAPTEATAEPVMWFEAEASAKGQPLRHVIGSMLYSTRMHTTKPEVLNNALWPLYEHPAPTEAAQREDSARLDAERYRWLCEKFGVTWLPCFLEDKLERGYIEDGKESIDAVIDRARASAETGGVKP